MPSAEAWTIASLHTWEVGRRWRRWRWGRWRWGGGGGGGGGRCGGAARLCEHPVPLDLAVSSHDLLLLLALPVDPRFLLGALTHRRRLERRALRLRSPPRALLLRQHL